MKIKLIVTGGSGFIGTNVIEHFLQLNYEVLNIDKCKPQVAHHFSMWADVDICNFQALQSVVNDFSPDYIVHLAARTDLHETENLSGYSANIEGVKNLVNVISLCKSIRRVIFASSMLVNEVGYIPKNTFDYNPTTLYGQSKVLTEQIIFENKDLLPDFCVIRPTSIWGEWFGVPYRNFFDFVLFGKYVHMHGHVCIKTYGYVGNAVFQIEKLLFCDSEKINNQVFYIGDQPPINISEWADEIAYLSKSKKIRTVPFWVFKFAAQLGDQFVKLGIKFPMTSFRLKNMTTNHIMNLDNTYEVCGVPPFKRTVAITNTLDWMSNR